jgi:hypothetical protein
MTAPQKEFNVTLPPQDNATPPDTLTAGEITSLVFVVGPDSYTYALPAGTAAGAAVTVLFSALTPPFVPVAGTAYSADSYAVDAGGNGALSNSVSWTQLAAAPLAPTNLSVA